MRLMRDKVKSKARSKTVKEGEGGGKRERQWSVMSAECGNVFFRDSSHDLFFKPRSCFIVSFQGGRKKGSENGVTTLHASRGLLFRTHGPAAEICRYTKIRERKEEERGKHFCFASVMSSAGKKKRLRRENICFNCAGAEHQTCSLPLVR